MLARTFGVLLAAAAPVLSSVLSSAPSARADEVDANRALATDLFDQGVQRMNAGACDASPVRDTTVCYEARDAFRRAYALYPGGLGALRNLAYVEANLGLVASAARNFRELTRRAPLDPSPPRRVWAGFAQKEADALAPRIPHLRLDTSAGRPPEMTLSLDGNALPEAGWDTDLDLDPGRHALHAEAPGYVPFDATFDVSERDQTRIAIVLEQGTSQGSGAPRPAGSAPAPLPPADLAPHAARPVLPLVLAGAGTVAVAVGLGLGYIAIHDRVQACGDEMFCEPTQLASGRSIAQASTVVTSVGAAAVATGLVWYFLSPARPSGEPKGIAWALPYAVPTGAGIAAHGTFE
jgi:hypothetical protein